MRRHLAAVEAFGQDAVLVKIAENIDRMVQQSGIDLFNRKPAYIKYSKKIQAIGQRVLGENHSLVLDHFVALRSLESSLSA